MGPAEEGDALPVMPRFTSRFALLAVFGAALWLASPGHTAGGQVRWCGTDVSASDRLPDAVSAFQVHVIYAFPSDGADRFGERASGIASDLADIDSWWRKQDAGRRPRFDLHDFPGCDSEYGRLDISRVQLPRGTAYYSPETNRIESIVADLVAAGFADPDKKYLVYYDGPVEQPRFCGVANAGVSEGGRDAYSLVYLGSNCGGDLGAGGAAAITAAHEFIHGLNELPAPFPSPGPPNVCPGDQGHVCDNPTDILNPELIGPTLDFEALDVGRDDYYGHSGSWPDAQDSFFLERLDSPDKSAPDGPMGLSVTSDPATGAVRVSWPAATDAVGPVTYRVYRDGKLLGVTERLEFSDSAAQDATLAYGVRAADGAGFLSPRQTIRFRVGLGVVDEAGQLLRDTVPPPAVSSLRQRTTKRGLVLRWSAVSDPGGLSGYRLERNGKPYRLVATTSIKIPRRQARGRWSVRALDRAGNLGPASRQVTVR